MYNRYIPNGAAYTRVSEPDGPPPPPPGGGTGARNPGLLDRLLKAVRLEDMDTGDLLLLLILLLLFLDGDDWELPIALGLVLLLSMGDS